MENEELPAFHEYRLPITSPPRQVFGAISAAAINSWATSEPCLPLQPASSGWPQIGLDSKTAVGPTAQKWAAKHRQQDSLPQELNTVVFREDEVAELQQTRWNAWLALGDDGCAGACINSFGASANPGVSEEIMGGIAGSESESLELQSEFGSARSHFQQPAGSTVSSPRALLEQTKSSFQPNHLQGSLDITWRDGVDSDNDYNRSWRKWQGTSGGSTGLVRHRSMPTSPTTANRYQHASRRSRSETGDILLPTEVETGVLSLTVDKQCTQTSPGRPYMSQPRRQSSMMKGPVYMRSAFHAKVPSADIGALNLHEYFSPLSSGLAGTREPNIYNRATPQRSDTARQNVCGAHAVYNFKTSSSPLAQKDISTLATVDEETQQPETGTGRYAGQSQHPRSFNGPPPLPPHLRRLTAKASADSNMHESIGSPSSSSLFVKGALHVEAIKSAPVQHGVVSGPEIASDAVNSFTPLSDSASSQAYFTSAASHHMQRKVNGNNSSTQEFSPLRQSLTGSVQLPAIHQQPMASQRSSICAPVAGSYSGLPPTMKIGGLPGTPREECLGKAEAYLEGQKTTSGIDLKLPLRQQFSKLATQQSSAAAESIEGVSDAMHGERMRAASKHHSPLEEAGAASVSEQPYRGFCTEIQLSAVNPSAHKKGGDILISSYSINREAEFLRDVPVATNQVVSKFKHSKGDRQSIRGTPQHVNNPWSNHIIKAASSDSNPPTSDEAHSPEEQIGGTRSSNSSSTALREPATTSDVMIILPNVDSFEGAQSGVGQSPLGASGNIEISTMTTTALPILNPATLHLGKAPVPPPLPRKAAQDQREMHGRPAPPPPPPPAKKGSLIKKAIQTSNAKDATKSTTRPSIIKPSDLAAGIGSLRRTTPGTTSKQGPLSGTESEKQQIQRPCGVAGLFTAADLMDAAAKLKKVEGTTTAAGVQSPKAKSKDTAGPGGAFAAILKRAQDIRASFYPESTTGSESLCSDWED